jgi:hypothetical protein
LQDDEARAALERLPPSVHPLRNRPVCVVKPVASDEVRNRDCDEDGSESAASERES